ncbi:MAG: transporter [Cytophagales bacterium]|nr:transporter [Cytophaga sp.]
MTDTEFELIDQLYFVQSFHDLSNSMGMNEKELTEALKNVFGKGWMKVLDKHTDAEIADMQVWEKDLTNFYYLATKKGLFAHNTI